MKTAALEGDLRRAWESAQELWGVHMHDAELRPGAGKTHGAPAWFRFPPAIVVDPRMVAELGGADEMESVFAHELGHHALAPGTRLDSLKIRHQLARTLVAAGATSVRDDDVAMLSNLWTDLLVNARVGLLQRRRDGPGEPGIVRLSRSLYRASRDTGGRLWWVYLRTYELLWDLRPGTLCAVQPPPAPARRATGATTESPLERIPERHREAEQKLREARAEAERVSRELAEATITRPGLDADLLAGLVRTFAGDAVSGALRFGVLVAPYLVAERAAGASMPGGECSADGAPPGAAELGRVLADPRLREPIPVPEGRSPGAARSARKGAGQALGVARTLELYEGADQDAVIAAWYRAEAARWVRPLTQRAPATPAEELPGPVETWETGDDLADLDWPATLRAGGAVIPGITTRRRSYLADDPLPRETSITLDLYIDSSGSMPNPRSGSPAVLAGTILALSILRGGGRVRVASFSGPGQVGGSETFTRDAGQVVRDLALFFAGGTTFPLDLLERRAEGHGRATAEERRHLVVLSDDGLVSMFGAGDPDRADVAARVRSTLTTGTLVVLDRSRRVEPLAKAAGYEILYLETMDDAPRACAELAEVLNG
ncbi:NAD/NADP transhydrogenase alpha subunit [Microbacterium testaceum StLB037]|uniref:NAD/NADP transhydrogenase alpha subunit n=1 Tax=Microbacterium testaceum (strain StLB037) TaxID=979556 RepID=E8NGU5_MICTS|nr:NAD/NADP transhydrogenase subunit alpha [Microbacterium testaceum]BAJ75394.1 NAD/NADP transhydrogenase alpha subunit [Microbacterium testaceum StLB037]